LDYNPFEFIKTLKLQNYKTTHTHTLTIYNVQNPIRIYL
jgi:hypothetical protein